VLADGDRAAAGKIASLLQKNSRDSTLRSRARQVAAARLSWDAHIETYRQVYRPDGADGHV